MDNDLFIVLVYGRVWPRQVV